MDDKIYNLLNRIISLLEDIKGYGDSSILFYDFLDMWLNDFKKNKVSSSTFVHLVSCVNCHIKGNLPNKPITSINAYDVQSALARISSSRMIEYTKVTLSEVFKKAVLLHYIRENPCSYVEVRSHVRNEGRALTYEQQKELFEKTNNNKYYYPLLFMRWTGCRPAEAFLVKWSDVDFDNDTVFIPGTKTDGSRRLVPLIPLLKDSLLSLSKIDGALIFSGSYSGLRQIFRYITLSFPFSPKDLRTTFATCCAENGVEIQVLSRWLGHTSQRTTRKYYIKVLPSFELKEAAKIYR